MKSLFTWAQLILGLVIISETSALAEGPLGSCPRSGRLPKLVLISEVHSSSGGPAEIRQSLFGLAKKNRALFASESGPDGEHWATWKPNLRYPVSANLHSVESEAWVVQESYMYQKVQLNEPQVKTGVFGGFDDHVHTLMSDPFARKALEAGLANSRDKHLQNLIEVMKSFSKDEDVVEGAKKAARYVEKIPQSELRSVANAVHRTLVQQYQQSFPHKQGIRNLRPLTEPKDLQKIKNREVPDQHQKQLDDLYNGEAQVNAIRSNDFATAIARMLCNGGDEFKTAFAVIGAAHADGVVLELRRLFGANLQVEGYDSRKAADVEKLREMLPNSMGPSSGATRTGRR